MKTTIYSEIFIVILSAAIVGMGVWLAKYLKKQCNTNNRSPGQAEWVVYELDKDGRKIVRNGRTSKAVISLDDDDIFTIGSSSDCQFRLKSHYVDKCHLVVLKKNGEYFAIDNESSNGTFFKGDRVKSLIPIADKKVLCLGDKYIAFMKNPALGPELSSDGTKLYVGSSAVNLCNPTNGKTKIFKLRSR